MNRCWIFGLVKGFLYGQRINAIKLKSKSYDYCLQFLLDGRTDVCECLFVCMQRVCVSKRTICNTTCVTQAQFFLIIILHINECTYTYFWFANEIHELRIVGKIRFNFALEFICILFSLLVLFSFHCINY